MWKFAYVPQHFKVKGELTRPAGLFLLHPDELTRKPLCDHGGSGSLGLHHQSSLCDAHLTDMEEAWYHAAKSRTASPPPEEPPENVLARSQTEESPVDVLVSPQTEALLETVLVAPLPQESLNTVFVETLTGELRRDLAEEDLSESVLLSPLQSLDEFAVLACFQLQCLSPSLPSWFRSK